MNKQTLMACGVTAVLLAACGGGGYEPPPVVPPVTEAIPGSANQSSAGLVTYLSALSAAAAAADDKDPLDLSKFNPVQPDDTEPDPLS